MSGSERKPILVYELIGMVFIIILGSVLHFTFERSGSQPVVGVFSAVNESVWETVFELGVCTPTACLCCVGG